MNTPVSTKVVGAIAAVFASCVTLGSVLLLFDSAGHQRAAAIGSSTVSYAVLTPAHISRNERRA